MTWQNVTTGYHRICGETSGGRSPSSQSGWENSGSRLHHVTGSDPFCMYSMRGVCQVSGETPRSPPLSTNRTLRSWSTIGCQAGVPGRRPSMSERQILVAALLHGLVSIVLIDAANRIFSLDNGRTEVGVTQPQSSAVSGGPGSLVAWGSLGLEGRSFTATAPSIADLSAFSGQPALSPVRVYVGLDSADSPQARAELAVRELDRTGAFSRKVLAVVATTGTGWVAPESARR